MLLNINLLVQCLILTCQFFFTDMLINFLPMKLYYICDKINIQNINFPSNSIMYLGMIDKLFVMQVCGFEFRFPASTQVLCIWGLTC